MTFLETLSISKGEMIAIEALQKELHQFTEDLMRRNKVLDYQDGVVVFMLMKIAQLQKQIDLFKIDV
jgi:hypothetical protein